MDVEKFVGFNENSVLNAISITVMFSEIIKIREKRVMAVTEDINSSLKLSTDNDSGYISQNVESNSISPGDKNVPILICTDSVTNVYVNEDALLEKPQLSNVVENTKSEDDQEEYEEFGHLYYMKSDSFVESSVVSQNSTFSGFDSSGSTHSNLSKIIPVALPLVLHCNNPIANELENDPNYININSNVTNRVENTCDKNYYELETNLSTTQSSLIDDNYANTLSFSSALCNLYDKGFGGSNNVSEEPEIFQMNMHQNEETSLSPCIKSYTELQTTNKLDDGNSSLTCTTSTPRKLSKSKNLEMSPELFSDDEAACSFEVHPLNNFHLQKSSDKQNISKNDRLLMTRLQESLCGVLPPPSVTIIQMSVEEMLDKIKENENLFIINHSSVQTSTDKENSENRKSLLVSCKEEDFEGEKWPNYLNYRYHGLCYNRSKIHEDMEYMYLRYAERYIGAETQSTCTVFGMGPDKSSPSKRRMKFRRPGKSPGKRLSHLARRRITFSKDSLQSIPSASSNSFIGSRTRQIMIDARKSELSLKRRSPFKKSSPNRSPRKKSRTPTSSAKKRYSMRLKLFNEDNSFDSISSGPASSSSKTSTTKRALFPNSPDKGRSTNGLLRLLGADTSENKSSKRRTPRRALFTSPLKSSPSKLGQFAPKPRLTPRRCLFSPDKSSSSCSQGEVPFRKRKRVDSEDDSQFRVSSSTESISSVSNDSTTRRRTISNGSGSIHIQNIVEHRKKKLMWAVAEALRPHNIHLKHPLFKGYASTLAKITRNFLPSLFVNGPRPDCSTTASMLKIARQHAFAVTRGRTAEEIVRDAKMAQLKPSKPTGYVGLPKDVLESVEAGNTAKPSGSMELEKVLTESAKARNRDNILHEHRGDSEIGYFKNRRKENVERIRKVIDFDEVGGTGSKR